jgi:hypothetical protein
MWLYVNSFRLCVCVSTYLVETMSWNVTVLTRQARTHARTHNTHAQTHTQTQNELAYSHIPTLFITNVNQHFNSVM